MALTLVNNLQILHDPNTFLNPTRRSLLELLKLDVQLVQANGVHLFDAEGNDYIDCIAQYGALPFGHNNPELWSALTLCFNQQIPSLVQPLLAIKAEELAARLAAITPGDLTYTILTNSGAETVEVAIKLARLRTGRTRILSTKNSFHGKTLGALSATGQPHYQEGFGTPLPGFGYVPFGDLAALEKELAEEGAETAAFLVEPIQGEGGIVPAPEAYLSSVQDLCHRYGVMFVVDEVQTGLGRTGTLFAIENEHVVPDMLLLAKALGGGIVSIGACVVRPHVWDDRFGLLHSSTFANNNVSAAVALKVLDLLAADNWSLVADVARKGEYLLTGLQAIQQKYPLVIKDVRGRGFMLGIEFFPFDGQDSYTMSYLSSKDLLVPVFSSYLLNVHRIITAPPLGQSHVLRIEPPLIMRQAEIDLVLSAIEMLAATLDHRNYYHLLRFISGNREKPVHIKDYHSFGNQIRPSPEPSIRSEHNGLTDRRRFAFLIHYVSEQDIIETDPSFEQFPPQELERLEDWFERGGPGVVYHIPQVRSITGASAEGWLIGIPMLPSQMLRQGSKNVLPFLEKGTDLARELGATIMGLGAFTAVVSKGGQKLVNRGIGITTGNTLTTLLAIEGVKKAANMHGVDLSSAHVAVVGASGSIGRFTSLLLAPFVGSLTLLGNPGSPDALQRCQKVAHEVIQLLSTKDFRSAMPGVWEQQTQKGDLLRCIQQSFIPEAHISTSKQELGLVTISTSLQDALVHADIVVMASSAVAPILHSTHLKDHAIVCDIAKPSSVAPDVARDRPDVYVFAGGIAQLPESVSFGPNLKHFHDGITVGCLAETILLALEEDCSDHSIGSQLSFPEADQLRKAMYRHGFALPPFPPAVSPRAVIGMNSGRFYDTLAR